MAKLPALKGRQIAAVLERAGFTLDRHGDHLIYRKGARIVPVPNHPGDIPRGTLRKIIDLSGMTVQEFLDLR
jgi:predicted RNA binding protein YcfA (HicA-like mRNA interferase family)